MCKILFFFLLFPSIWGISQNFIIQDSIEINIPDSYNLHQADIFNSLYFTSKKENSLIKYNPITKEKYILENFTPSKKLFIINSLFIVILDKINKTLEFYDDKFISTQDKVSILSNQMINPNLIYVQDNKLLTYFDEFKTNSFVQYDYRAHKNLFFSNSISNNPSPGYFNREIFVTKYSRFILSKEINTSDSTNKEYKIISQNMNNGLHSYDIPQLDNYFWNEKKFIWITDDYIYSYDFENEPKKIELPKKGENYYILNGQLFLWKSKVVYLYRIETEN